MVSHSDDNEEGMFWASYPSYITVNLPKIFSDAQTHQPPYYGENLLLHF
jgi:hypothetical protein